jgi:hypothetical protein
VCRQIRGIAKDWEPPIIDDLVKSRKSPFSVIPAKAGIQEKQAFLEPAFAGVKTLRTFYEFIIIQLRNNVIYQKGEGEYSPI